MKSEWKAFTLNPAFLFTVKWRQETRAESGDLEGWSEALNPTTTRLLWSTLPLDPML